MAKYTIGIPEVKTTSIKPGLRFRLANWLLKGTLFNTINELIFYDLDRLAIPQEMLIKEVKEKGSVTISVTKDADGNFHSKDPYYILMVGQARKGEINIINKLSKMFWM